MDRELRRIDPPAFPVIEVVKVQGDHGVLVLKVAPSRQGPHSFEGRPYLRQGPQTLVMPRSRYEELLFEHFHPTHRWENVPVPQGVGVEDLDLPEIHRVLNAAVRQGRMDWPPDGDVPAILTGFGLIKNGVLLQAALALFGKADHLQSLYPQFCIRLARFRGLDKLAPFGDNRRYWGHAFQLLHRAESFLLDHTQIASRVLPRMEREDVPAYLPAVTREGLANALCHRDYSQASGSIGLAMFDDRLEITNPGGLHFGLTPEDLAAPHPSMPWNPIIAGVFYRAGIIETWGSGTLRMLEMCKGGGRPLPTWESKLDGVWMVLPSPQVLANVTPEVTPEALSLLPHCKEPKNRKALQGLLGLRDPDHFRLAYLQPALVAGLIEMTIPGKPNSRLQRYRTTPAGLRVLDGGQG